MITSITASVFIGALLWMDREYALQIQISRPVVISAILGLIMGKYSNSPYNRGFT